MGPRSSRAERRAADGVRTQQAAGPARTATSNDRDLLGALSRALPLLLAIASAAAAAGVRLTGEDAAGALGLAYVWVAIAAFALLPRGVALLEVGIGVAAYAWALDDPVGADAGRWLAVTATALGAGLVVQVMRVRIDALSARVHESARADPLTGLLNRLALDELLGEELELARGSNRALSVAVGDVDGFQALNERIGPEAGDRALRSVAYDLAKWKRGVDLAARIGGDEFALVLPGADRRGAFLASERMRRAAHLSLADEPVRLTVSFGIASFPDHAASPGTLLELATRAMLAAKATGRDRCMTYSSEVESVLSAAGGLERG